MSDVKWIKIVTNIFDNRKIKQIETLPEGDTILVIWFKLICLAGSINDNGMVYLTPEIPYTEEMIASQFGRPLTVVRLALRTFEAYGMVEIVDNFLSLPSWEKYQSADRLERMRSKNAERQARFRAKQRGELPPGSPESNAEVTPGVTQRVTPSNAVEEEKDIEEELEENITFLPEAEPAPAPQPKVVITILLNDKTEYPITEADVEGWKELYPAVDVMQELRKMKGWADANPAKRKTKGGIKRFINSWLAKEQDRYHGPTGGVTSGTAVQQSGKKYGTCI